MTDFDDLIIGSGMAGLAVGALLARSGRRVGILEAHDEPGGYAHSFRMKDYRFCAQFHYIFHCGEGETIHELLTKLGVADEVPFVRLDPEGFDHVVVSGERVRIPNGLPKLLARLLGRFPEAERPLRRDFDVVRALGRERDRLDLPENLVSWKTAVAAARSRHSPRMCPGTRRRRAHELVAASARPAHGAGGGPGSRAQRAAAASAKRSVPRP